MAGTLMGESYLILLICHFGWRQVAYVTRIMDWLKSTEKLEEIKMSLQVTS